MAYPPDPVEQRGVPSPQKVHRFDWWDLVAFLIIGFSFGFLFGWGIA